MIKKHSFWWSYVLCFFALQLSLRIVFISLDPHFDILEILKGLSWDRYAWSILSLPFLALISFTPKSWWQKKFVQRLETAHFTLFTLVVLFVSMSEIFFWLEFKSRFNFIAVDYLVYTNEVLNNILESFPMAFYLSLLFGIALLISLGRFFWMRNREYTFPDTLLKRPLFFLVSGLLFPLAMYFLALPLLDRPAKDFNRDQIARNGWVEFVTAFRSNRLDWKTLYVTFPENELTPQVTHMPVQPRAKKLNVVFILVESLGAKFIKDLGGFSDATPRLNALKDKSLFFTQLYANGTRTVRGLEAVTLSVPPTPGYAMVKRPDNSNLASIGSVFNRHGYQNTFLYGGRAFFDNMGAFFGGNGFKVVDEGDFSKEETTFANAWGVCDRDLFQKELKLAEADAKTGKPFLHFLLTTSNHRPFTYPEGVIDIPSGTSRLGAVKYTDFTIGEFLEEASTKDWAKNTIFIVAADHSTEGRGRFALEPADFHIPMWIYSPSGLVPAKTYDKMMGQVDILPTLLTLLGLDWSEPFFGSDVLSGEAPERAYIGNYQYVGYLDPEALTVMGPKKFVAHYRVEKNNLKKIKMPKERVLKAASAYQRASDLLDRGLYKNLSRPSFTSTEK